MLTLNFTPYPILTTERLVLRKPLITDDEETFIMRNDEVVNKYIDRPKTESIQDAQNVLHRLIDYIDNDVSMAWVINVKGDTKLLGTICLWNIDKENEVADIGYELNPCFHGKGIMSEALSKVLEYGFNEMHLRRIEGWVHKDNRPSIKLLEKFEFVKDENSEERVAKEHAENMVIYTLARKL